MSNYSNPEEHLVKLTPDLRNLGTEGSLDTSILNGVSLQRTMNMIQVESNQGEIKIIGNRKDGTNYDNVVVSPYEQGWTSIIDTAYLYPNEDINVILPTFRSASPTIVENGSDIIFTDINHLYDFYEAVFNQTAVSQPVGNVGFSLGVGTKLQDLGVTLNLKLQNGLTIVTWTLVKQLYSQNSLAVGGDSPKGTVGYVTTYCDWDQSGKQDPTNLIPGDIGFYYGDPLRVRTNPVTI
jgi:hypothetical protein